MLKLFIVLLFSFQGIMLSLNWHEESSHASSFSSINKAETYVYICNSSSAKKYHLSKTCRGLNACTHEIKKIPLSQAKGKYKKTLCGWED